MLICVVKAVQEETSRNVDESAGWLFPARGRLQPVHQEAGGLPHPTNHKGEDSPEASHLVRSQNLVADKLKEQGIGEPKSSSLELEYKQC